MDASLSAYANLGVMLAEPHKTVAPTVDDAIGRILHPLECDKWQFDLKWDGVRALALVNPPQSRALDGAPVTTLDGVALVNRNGVDITYRYPDVCHALAMHFGSNSVVLDGEIVAFDSDGKPDFEMLSRRDRVGSEQRALEAAKHVACTYVAFDLLAHDDRDFMDHAWIARRKMLELAVGASSSVILSPASEDGATMWRFVHEHGLEGLIAKRVTSQYQSGRSPAWVKLKPTKTVSCVVTGFEWGKDRHEGVMGALHIGLYDGDQIMPIGKVGTGFSDKDREHFAEHLQHFAPVAYADEHGHYGVIVEVEYQGRTKAGKLRFPAYRGVRTDLVAHRDCTVKQVV